MKEGFVYLWFDTKRKMFYVGCHWGTINDGYICSSNRMRDAYYRRKNDFKRRILKRGISRNLLLEVEFSYLQLIKDEELGTRYYNLSKRHFGHWANTDTNHTVREKLSISMKALHQDPVYRDQYMAGRKKMPPQTKEQIEKRSKANIGKKRSDETKKKISDSHIGKTSGPLSAETKQKLSVSLSGDKNPFYGKKHDKDLKKSMSLKASKTMKGRRPKNLDMFVGTKWWNNGIVNKRSKEYPGDGWLAGRM